MGDNTRTLKFRGIDDWGRPVFKVIEKDYFVGSTETLFPYNANPKEVVEYFKENKNELRLFGYSFGCEPDGAQLKSDLDLVIQE